jgi:AcrR family transcriptional regulator
VAAGRRAGDPDTRGEIIAAARREFAEKGFDRTSLRGVARAAGVDAALVHHYFDGKNGLFLACIQVDFRVDQALARALRVPRDQVGSALIGFVVSVWDDPDRRSPLLALLRSVTTNAEVAAMMREGVVGTLLSQVLDAVQVPAGRRPETASLLMPQVVGLIMSRYVLRVEPLASMSAAEVADLMGPVVQFCLTRHDA